MSTLLVLGDGGHGNKTDGQWVVATLLSEKEICFTFQKNLLRVGVSC